MVVKRNKGLILITALMLVGMFVANVAQFNPSSVLTVIMEDLSIDMAQGGFGISVVFIPIIIFSLLGPFILTKIGLKNMFSLAMLFLAVGVSANMIVENFTMFLFGRICYGIGYGLITPFIGAAIMQWYNPRQQGIMNTLNALLPYISSLVVYGLTIPLVKLFHNSWRSALSVWGFIGILILIIWFLFIKNEGPVINSEISGEISTEKNIYFNLLKRKEIIILIVTFACDFISYSVLSSMLPTLYQVEAGMSIEMANNVTLIIPVAAIIGGIVAGYVMARTQRRKTLLWLGQSLKVVGITMIYFGGAGLMGYAGIALVGIGNIIWIPSMYSIPMELEAMTPTLVGAAFALITSSGFISGFAAPIFAGWLGEQFSLRFAIFLSAFPCLIGLIACTMIRETGPGKKYKS